MKVCFWGNIAKALNGNTIGGGELQLAFIAKALAIGGHEVVVIDTEISENFETEDGIKIYKIDGWNSGIPFIRTFTHRLPRLYKSFKNMKADVYYCRIRDFRHILAFRAARKLKAKFILGTASDLDVLNLGFRAKHFYLVNHMSLWSLSNGILTEIFYPILLRKADLVLVQHSGQRNILLKKNIHSVIFPNIYKQTNHLDSPVSIPETFAYVGSLDKRKGFVEFYELVSRTPSHNFVVIGSPRDKTATLFYEKLKKFQNVSLLGMLNHSETLNCIANSKALISTSPMEGFPNVFIEAWARGIPVLSLYVDPGDIIKREKLGVVAYGDMDKMIEAMNKIENNSAFELRAKNYVKNVHTLSENRIGKICSLFSNPTEYTSTDI